MWNQFKLVLNTIIKKIQIIKFKYENKIYKFFGLWGNNVIILSKKTGEERIYFKWQFPKNMDIKISFEGHNNKIILDAKTKFRKCHFILRGNNSIINIKPSKYYIRNLEIGTGGGNFQSVFIDEDFSCEQCAISLWDNNASVKIGKDCMLAYNIILMAADGHVVFSNSSKQCINISQPIIIGDHVWLGRNVSVLKGCNIPNNSIIALGSVVTKSFGAGNVVIAGNPAKIVKNNIGWDRAHIPFYNN